MEAWQVILMVSSIIAFAYAVLVFWRITPDGIFFKYDKNNKKHRFIRKCVITVVSLYCFVMVWWLVSIFANTEAIPTPVNTFNKLIELFVEGDKTISSNPTMWAYMASSLKTFLLGFLVAFIIAVPLGLLIGNSKTLQEFTSPVIEVLRPIAPIAWAPILILAIGYNVGPILVVAIGIFFPLLTNTIFGVAKIDKILIDASKTLGANSFQIFKKVVLPCSVPYIMSGIKIGLGIGWMCIIAAELYAPSLGGIGGFLSTMAFNTQWECVYAAIIMIAFLGILTTGLAGYIHKVLSKWMGVEE